MLTDESSQVRADLVGRIKPCCLCRGFLVLRGDLSALRIMFQVPEYADGEDVPLCALFADKNEVLRLFQGVSIQVLHLALFMEFVEFARQGYEHFHVKEPTFGKSLAQIGDG